MNKHPGKVRRVWRRMRTRLGQWRGTVPRIDRDCSIPTWHLGTEYGGHRVALDLLPPDEAIAYSAGVGHDVSFDIELSRIGIRVLRLIDPTPGVFENPAVEDFVKGTKHVSTHSVALAGDDHVVEMWPPENEHHVSHSAVNRSHRRPITVEGRRLISFMAECGDEGLDILKMDIEGSEYEVIEDLANTHIRPSQLMIEFHHRMPGIGVQRTEAAVETLRQIGYAVVSVSDTCQEVTFVLRRFLRGEA